MIRSVASKVAWVGRTASMVFGLALVLALVLGVASTALGKNGQSVILGKAANTATRVTGLIGKVASGSALVVNNPSGGSALGLQVDAGQAPLTVNADAGTATNLSADQVDGQEASAFQKRVSDACAVGSSIRAIDANGLVTCEQDDDLSGDPAGGDLSGDYPNPQIAPNAVSGGSTGEIANNTVTADDIALNTLTQDDIATGGVGSEEVENRSLRLQDIAADNFTRDVDFGNIAAGNCNQVLFANVTPADVGDLPIVLTSSGSSNRLVASSRPVVTDNAVFLALCNLSNEDLDPPSTTFHFIVLRP